MASAAKERYDFGKVGTILDVPNLIEIQTRSFEVFLQKDIHPEDRQDLGLQAAFRSVFPITDYNETASIEFIEYTVGEPKFNVPECLRKGLNFSAPLKIKVKLNLWESTEKGERRLKESKEQEVYIGEMPLMTVNGTFVVNGTERVIVSQLHRSPGVFFSHDKGKTQVSGRLLYSARVIPARGSWLDFEFDTKDILYVRIDRRKKLPATIVLKALGYSNEDLLRTFYPIETVKVSREGFTRPVSKVLVGMKVKDPLYIKGSTEPIVKEGGKISRGVIKRLEAAGVTEIPMERAEVIDRITLSDIIDPETGEVIVESNEPIKEDSLEKILTLKIPALNLLFIDNTNYLPALRDTLLTDKVHRRQSSSRSPARPWPPSAWRAAAPEWR